MLQSQSTTNPTQRASAAQTRQPCKGWILLNGIIAKCPKHVTRNRNNSRRYHSLQCGTLTRTMRRAGLVLGGTYVKNQTVKHLALCPCKEWVIRDGEIAECGQLFKPTRRKDAGSCPEHVPVRHRYELASYGYKLGDSVKRTCGFRNCKNGEGGTRKTFNQIRRSSSGEYHCCRAHTNAEGSARQVDKLKIKLERLHTLEAMTERMIADNLRSSGLDLKPASQIILAKLRSSPGIGNSDLKTWLRANGHPCPSDKTIQRIRHKVGLSLGSSGKPRKLSTDNLRTMTSKVVRTG